MTDTAEKAENQRQLGDSSQKTAGARPPLRPGPRGGKLLTGGVRGNRGGTGRPIVHGYYSAAHRESLRDLVERHRRDPDPLNLLDELALARAVAENFIGKITVQSLTAEVATAAIRLLGNISLIAKRIEDARAKDAIPLNDLIRVMELMGQAVNDTIDRRIAARSPSELVEDAGATAVRIREEIRERWMEIRID